MPAKPLQRTVVIWLLSFVLGVGLAALKGDGAGIRDVLGNLSIPYLLTPFLAGMQTRSFLAAVTSAVLASELCVSGFYAYEAMRYGMVNQHTAAHIFTVAFAGILTGVLYGWLGLLWKRRGLLVAGISLGIAGLTEPLLLWASGHFYRASGGADTIGRYPIVFLTEALLGLTVCAWVISMKSTQRAAVS